jgi:Flp pilus assembly pilin Flp
MFASPNEKTYGRASGCACLKRFGRDQKAATAVEFSLIALPFVALLFAILETALIFLAGQTLETGVADAARLIRTGQAQKDGLVGDTFKAAICAQAGILMSCTGSLKVDVRHYDTFDSLTSPDPVDADGNLKDDFIYDAGHGGDIVVVRAFYEWPTFSKLLGLNFSNLADGNHLLAATAAFKNEPFPW